MQIPDKRIWMMINNNFEARMEMLWNIYDLKRDIYNRIETDAFRENIFSVDIEESLKKISIKFYDQKI
jgi:hypothetical protein